MNLPDISEALTLGASALGILKSVKDLMPDSKEKEEATAKLEKAENDLKIAQARTAKDLGYQLCYCSLPPSVMLQNKDDIWVCQSCGKEYSPVGIG